jgi:hypothetical protein
VTNHPSILELPHRMVTHTPSNIRRGASERPRRRRNSSSPRENSRNLCELFSVVVGHATDTNTFLCFVFFLL